MLRGLNLLTLRAGSSAGNIYDRYGKHLGAYRSRFIHPYKEASTEHEKQEWAATHTLEAGVSYLLCQINISIVLGKYKPAHNLLTSSIPFLSSHIKELVTLWTYLLKYKWQHLRTLLIGTWSIFGDLGGVNTKDYLFYFGKYFLS